MKKLSVLTAVLLAALFVVGCATKPSGPTSAEVLAENKANVPSGVLVGQATASNQATAERNAAAQVKRALKFIASELVDAQVKAGGINSAISTELKQTINTALDNTTINGLVKVGSGAEGGGWAIFTLNKEESLKEVNIAVNVAKENVGGSGNFDPNEGFSEAFAKAADLEWKQ